MATTTEELRSLAASCLTRARTAGPNRAQQLRECARHFARAALRLELFEHGKQVGRARVTQASFREHLRTQRA
jgi:hypothetical protein